MRGFPFMSLLFYMIIMVSKAANAACPCHVPVTGQEELCTCYGPCGDDGYGCKANGEDYEFLNQIQCREAEWQIQCLRTATLVHTELVKDDTNPYAAYQLDAQSNNFIDDDFTDDTTQSQSMTWFGGNWFDFWGQNDGQFFSQENAINSVNIKTDNDIMIDNQDFDSLSSLSAQRSLQTAHKSAHPILDDLGRNEAGYQIIALPLYILIICIVSSSILGMLMCAGFVYCGLHCCCPIPPQSPILSASQRNNSMEMTRVLQSLTLGGGYKSYDNSGNGYGHSVYHRMRNALHNPTADEASLSTDICNDEYRDSEDEQKGNDIVVTKRGDIEEESFALIGKCDSDIDRDSEDSMIRVMGDLIESRMDMLGVVSVSVSEEKGDRNEYNEDMDMGMSHMSLVTVEDDSAVEMDEVTEIEDTECDEEAPLIDSNDSEPKSNNSNLP